MSNKTVKQVVTEAVKLKNSITEYTNYFMWCLDYDGLLLEVGDLNNIQPLPNVNSVIEKGVGKKYFTELPNGKDLTILFKDVSDSKDAFHNGRDMADKADTIVNVSFDVGGRDSNKGSLDTTTFFRIMKTVQECAIDYMKDYNPDILIVSSQLPDNDVFHQGKDRSKEERIKIEYYKGFVLHIMRLLANKDYSYASGPMGPFNRNVFYLYKRDLDK